MSYFDTLLTELSQQSKSLDDATLVRFFSQNRENVEEHFELSVSEAIESCEEELTVDYIVEEVGYIFHRGFRMFDVMNNDDNLLIWEILRYENTNFWDALKVTAQQIVELETEEW